MSEKIETSIEFWKNIIKKRNFDEKGYDLEATNYIKDKFNLPKDKTILFGLKSKEKDSEPIGLEEFIKVFFESMEYFSNMMSDLLNMFEEISAKQTDKNLDIEFDFNKGNNPITVNIEKFKKYKSILIDIQYEIPNLDIVELQKLHDIVVLDYKNEIFGNDSVRDWIDYYHEHEQMLSYFPNIDIDSNSPLWTVFKIWKNFVNQLKEDSSLNTKYNTLVSNKWIESIVTHLSYLSEKSNRKDVQNKENKLKDFFNKYSVKTITVNEKIEKFEEFLKLPFWDKRYELYSVWVFSLIYKATKEYCLTVHTVGNKLIFPFKETHLATIDCNQGNILIFSEKRTLLNNPVGKYRTKHIQPDYSFYIEPITDTGSSIFEIECKQYKKQSTDNFARALIDYSNGRENANVFLVNYGDINEENIFKKIDELAVNGIDNHKDRCATIGKLKPNSNENLLIDAIQNKVSKYGCIKNSFIFSTPFKVELYWEEPLKDLDLYLEFTQNNMKKKIYYRNKEIDSISLNKDVLEGSIEPEIITINSISKGLYSFFVHNYTGNKFDENVICKIIVNDEVYKEIRPSSIEGNYWKLFDIDTERCNFSLINEVSSKDVSEDFSQD